MYLFIVHFKWHYNLYNPIMLHSIIVLSYYAQNIMLAKLVCTSLKLMVVAHSNLPYYHIIIYTASIGGT